MSNPSPALIRAIYTKKEHEMRRPSFFLIVGIVAALAVGAWLVSPVLLPAEAGHRRGIPTGTYLAEFKVDKASLLAVADLHLDGTWTMSDQTDFGGVPGLESKQTPYRGIWKITGPNQTTFTGLCFNFAANGAPTVVSRVTGVLNWTPGFGTANGIATQRFYKPGQDPLDPYGGTPYPPPLASIPVTVRKMVR